MNAASHRRINQLTGEAVLVSPQRLERPWRGQVDAPASDDTRPHDPSCHLCPRNARAGGERNPDYRGPWAFDNDFPALSKRPGDSPGGGDALFASAPETGWCRVICYTERHDRPLSAMAGEELAGVLRFLFSQAGELEAQADIGYVQLFENRGDMMGCSNPHPHAQAWATRNLPNEPAKELREQAGYLERHGRPLLVDYLDAEVAKGERLVYVNERAVSLVPWWAAWPFETLLAPRAHAPGPGEMDEAALRDFALALQTTLQAYDALFDAPMPYSLGFHPRPSDGQSHPEWQFHAHIYPPLLRSASVRKHMVGFEMLGMPQRDLTPEAAAERLRAAWSKAQK